MGATGESRPADRPGWARLIDILVRTAHVAVAGILLGGYVFGVPDQRLGAWVWLVWLTGLGLVASEVYHSRHWPYQGRGLAVFLKLAVLALAAAEPAWRVPVLATVLAIGMGGSHMPKRFRHWSLVHKRVID